MPWALRYSRKPSAGARLVLCNLVGSKKEKIILKLEIFELEIRFRDAGCLLVNLNRKGRDRCERLLIDIVGSAKLVSLILEDDEGCCDGRGFSIGRQLCQVVTDIGRF